MKAGLVVLALAVCGPAKAQGTNVWVASPWEHVLRDAEPRDGTSVELQAARNEYEPFRVIVAAGDEAISQVKVSTTALKGPAGSIQRKHIALFREHYVHCFEPSLRSTAEPGWYPDALVPLRLDPNAEGVTYGGQPFDVAAGENQGIWIDIYVPPSAGPGEYHGQVIASAGERVLGRASVSLTVWDFELPETFAMRSNFGSLGGRVAGGEGVEVGTDEFARVEDAYIDTMLAHRCQPSTLGSIWPTRTEDGGLDDRASGERLRTMVEERHVNSLMLPFSYRDDPEKCKSHLGNLAEHLRERGWLDLAYIYMKDEPNDPEEYEVVRQQGELLHEADPGIRRMCTEQTITSNPEWGDLYGAVDVWCPLWGLWDEVTARERQALGEELWSYTALCQCAETNPFWQIDFPPVSFRAPFWVSWHYGVTGFLYWSSVYWPPDHDPWVNPHFRDKYWGEGMLLYPGKPVGIVGPVTSIRLKLIREAMEDFEYMTLAAGAGRKSKVDRTVRGLARSFTDWERDPDAYMAARAELAEVIERGQ